jgi:hypothetical protein
VCQLPGLHYVRLLRFRPPSRRSEERHVRALSPSASGPSPCRLEPTPRWTSCGARQA